MHLVPDPRPGWSAGLSAVAAGTAPSDLGALFAAADDPHVVSLAGGMPDLTDLPWDRLAAITRDLLATAGPQVLQYGTAAGRADLRAGIVDVVAEQGIRVGPDDLLVTTGSQQALDLVARALLDPGDVVLVESPSYIGALGIFAVHRAHVVHVPMDADGMDPAGLETVLSRLVQEGRRVKFVYTVPHHQNPAGVTLSAARRPAVLDVAGRYGVPVLEDDPYALLGFEGPPLRALQALDPASVIHTGSFSKTLAPGFRLGWVIAPPPLLEKLTLLSEAGQLCPSGLTQAVVARYLETVEWRAQVEVFRTRYRARRDAVLETLATALPEASWTKPDGGFYVWLTLPDGLDATELVPAALAAGVAYVPGAAFYANGSGRDQIRLAYCYPTPERIGEGVRRLAAVVRTARR